MASPGQTAAGIAAIILAGSGVYAAVHSPSAPPPTLPELPQPPKLPSLPKPPPLPELPNPLPTECNPNYSGCLDQPGDYDCAGGSGNGPNYTGRVEVLGEDEYDLDRDGDGIGCERS